MTAVAHEGHGWARTRGPQERPYPLAPVLAAAGVGHAGLAEWADLTERAVRRLEEVGLTETQALIFADIAGVRPGRIWPELGASS